MLEPIKWDRHQLHLLDQTKLPHQTTYISCKTVGDVEIAIKEMVVRGAPAIGIAAAYGMVLASKACVSLTASRHLLLGARPTAVNLRWAVDQMMQWENEPKSSQWVNMEAEAIRIHKQDEALCRAIGHNGSSLLPNNARVYHHCNTGALATGGWGTALGVIRTHHSLGRLQYVFVGETRPRLQGARLTTYELAEEGITHSLVVDSAFAHLASTLEIDAVLVGADRVTANGDVANKIGTHSLAVMAHHFNIPFYVCFPSTTYDARTASGKDIPIEERGADEVRGDKVAERTRVMNPAFDVTPAGLVTSYVTELGNYNTAKELREAMNEG